VRQCYCFANNIWTLFYSLSIEICIAPLSIIRVADQSDGLVSPEVFTARGFRGLKIVIFYDVKCRGSGSSLYCCVLESMVIPMLILMLKPNMVVRW
jgi:hypothetical protein